MAKTICIPNYSLRKTLTFLIEKHGIPSGSELAKKINLPIPTVNRLLAGSVTDPRASTLLTIAEYFGISIDQLIGKVPLPDNICGNVEEFKFSLKVPILTFSDILTLNKNTGKIFTKYYNYLLDRKNDFDPDELFAIEIKDNSFFPTFSPDTTLIINSKLLPPENDDYVLIKFNISQTITIKKFYVDPPNKYFIPIKAGLETIIYNQNEHEIIGVICESYTQLK